MTSPNPIPLELQAKIADWRLKAATGELTLEEMKEAIRFLRAGREAAAVSPSAALRKKAIAVIPSAEDLLSELDGL